MADQCISISESVLVAASGAIAGLSSGYLQGLLVNASSAGTLTLADKPDGTNSRTILNAIPLTAGQSVILFGIRFTGGLTATIGGTASVTISYAA